MRDQVKKLLLAGASLALAGSFACRKSKNVPDDELGVKSIGMALYGEDWASSLAQNIKQSTGISLSKKDVEEWHKSRKIPFWAFEEIRDIARQRLERLDVIYSKLNDIRFTET